MSHHEGRFIYRGHAVGAASSLFRVQAPSSLPVIGGISRGSVGAFPNTAHDCRDDIARLISFESAATRATGLMRERTRTDGEWKQTYETIVNANASGIRLLRYREGFRDQFIIESDLVTARLESERPVSWPPDRETPITVPRSSVQITGLRVLGTPVKVTFDDELIEIRSKEESDLHFRKRCPQKIERVNDYYFYSLVENIYWEEAPSNRHYYAEKDDHTITVFQRGNGEQVAKLYMGEVIRYSGSCRLTLFRADLNYDADDYREGGQAEAVGPEPAPEALQKLGEAVFCEVESNGIGG